MSEPVAKWQGHVWKHNNEICDHHNVACATLVIANKSNNGKGKEKRDNVNSLSENKLWFKKLKKITITGRVAKMFVIQEWIYKVVLYHNTEIEAWKNFIAIALFESTCQEEVLVTLIYTGKSEIMLKIILLFN